MRRPKKACERNGFSFRLGGALLAGSLILFLSGGRAGAAEFTIHTNMDIPGLDIPSANNPLSPPAGSEESEIAHCRRSCELSPRCMAFTWVRGERGVRPANCFFKASAQLLDNNALGLLTLNRDTATGVKIYPSRACWARHIFNLKFCNVVSADGSGPAEGLECPAGSRTAVLGTSSPGLFNTFCVVRLAEDPGGLPNCTDAFGGETHGDSTIGNAVNQACLDAD
jgi:hypothetical protein